jgi:hypothetical protein
MVRQSFLWMTRLVAVSALLSGGPACSDCSLSISTHSLPNGTVGVRYFAALNSQCGGDTWFIQTGELPPGIGLQDNGDIQGTPTVAGLFTFTVGVFDFGSGETAFKGFSLEVDEPAGEPTPTSTVEPTETPTS